MLKHKNLAIEIEASEQPFLDEIAERLFSGHAAIMVGAGFSRNAVPKAQAQSQFPTWVELGDAFYEKLYRGEREAGIDEKKKYLNPLKLALQVETNFGRPTLDKIIADRIPDMYYEPSCLHEKLLELPWQDVFTTNYDTLLERASRKVLQRKYSFIVNADDLIYAEKPRIIKLHGSLPSTRPFIITEEDYRRYPKCFAPFVNTVQQSLLENALCLIGFSGDDPNFLNWIGWIRDNIGTERSSKMYFIGIDPVTPVDRTIFDQRHIIYIDASKCTRKGNPGAKIEAVLNYLASKENRESGIYWRVTNASLSPRIEKPADKQPKILEIIAQWKDTREKYPGWCITPASQRKSIWTFTSEWLGELKQGEALPDYLDFDFFYELNWRLERCLYPLFTYTAEAIRDCLSRYWPFADQNLLSQSARLQEKNKMEREHNFAPNRWCTLALSLLRYYREEGLSEDWTLFANILKDHEDLLSSEQRASFAYERCLYCLFRVDLEGLDNEFESWQENLSIPFWEAKRAGLLAERGRIDDAVKLLDRCLADIRAKQNLKPISYDFTLVSQEAYVMVLRKYVGEASSLGKNKGQKEENITGDYFARWNELKQYLCDPWEELSAFERKLEAQLVPRQVVTMNYGFDIGSVTRTRHLYNGVDIQVLDGYSFLRFLEETAIPVSLPFMTFGKEAAIKALPRIAPYSSYWALCEASRIGDSKVADLLFDRRALSRLDQATVDSYIASYIQTAKRIIDAIEQSSDRGQTSLSEYATKAIPEILSRLCCKSSPESREKILSLIEDIYKAKKKGFYSSVDHLVMRLIASASWQELDAYVPRFLNLEILREPHPLLERQFINPLQLFFNLDYFSEDKNHQIAIEPETIERLFQNAVDQNETTQVWSIESLMALNELGGLDEKQKNKLGELIWSGNPDRLPEHGSFFKFAFLALPIPEGIDAQGNFKRYLLEAPLPILGDPQKGVTLTQGDLPIIADLLGSAKYLDWTDSEVHTLFKRLISWWDSDKHYLGSKEKKEDSEGFRSIPEEARTRLVNLPDIMAKVIAPLLSKGAREDDIKCIAKLMAEARAANIPYLKMKLAFTSLFPEEHSNLVGEMSEALSSSRREMLVDALRAIVFSLDNPQGNALLSSEELSQLLDQVGDIIRWRYEPGLVSAMNTVKVFIQNRPECFNSKLQASLLAGLKELIHETDPTAQEPDDMPKKLEIRRAAAVLSFILFKQYRSTSQEIPEPIRAWEALGASSQEFAEIRKIWTSNIGITNEASFKGE